MKIRLPNLGFPMLAKELAEMAQRRGTYFVRVAFAILLFSIFALLLLPSYRRAQGSPTLLLGRGAELLSILYAIEWFGLCLFVPAIVSGALAAEKERNTLQLLLLTRLGPWTILFEKLLSRFVPVATFLLASLPLLFIAYSLGGLTRSDLGFAAAGLAATAFQVASIAMFCSAFCATSASAFVTSYVLIAFIFLLPPLSSLVFSFLNHWVVMPLGYSPFVGAESPGHAWYVWLNSTQGITDWIFSSSVAPFPAFHTTLVPLLVITSIGLFFLLLARGAIERRAAPQPMHRVRRLFRWLDRVFGRLNDRFAKGILFSRPGNDLPGNNPVAWRESRRGNLGRIHYLVRVLLVLELPILLFTVLSVTTTRDMTFSGLRTPGLLLWSIALLVVFVRSAGLIAGEKAHETLDVLLATPLPLSALVGQKMRGLWRVMAVVSVPILVHVVLVGYLQGSHGARRWSYYRLQGFDASTSARIYVVMAAVNLLILLGLAAQLAFLFGLRAKTQGRAVTAVLGVFVAWCFIPVMVRIYANTGGWTLYFSPISGLLANEYPEQGDTWWLRFGMETGRWGFYLLIHSGIYAAIVVTLAWVNRRLAGRVLLRSVIVRSHSRPPFASTGRLGYVSRLDAPGG